MPHYRKKGTVRMVTITNQDAVLYPPRKGSRQTEGSALKLPHTRYRQPMPHIRTGADLREVHLVPYHGIYLLTMVIEDQAPPFYPEAPETAAIDFGVDNIAAIVCTDGSAAVYKGGALLAGNRLFAKEKGKAVSLLTRGKKHAAARSAHLDRISVKHRMFTHDQLHKLSTSIIRYCVRHRVGTLVLGVNRYWKQGVHMGRRNNQNFVFLPIAELRDMILWKAQIAGIVTILQEESYTSKADITVRDYIPTYGVDDHRACFHGRRTERGLYRCSGGLEVNADCNGAANIMRKALPDIWGNRTDFRFLAVPESIGFRKLNPKYQTA